MRLILFYFLSIFFFTACGNADSPDASSSDTLPDSTTIGTPKTSQSSNSGSSIDLRAAEYSITTSNFKEDPHLGMPSFDIYLHISGAADSILIANDYAASFFDAASMDNYVKLIPADAVFLINSYYAGGGYYYYGIPENNVLKIYRIYQEEGNPDNDGVNMAPPVPQLMMNAKIFSDHNEVAALAIE